MCVRDEAIRRKNIYALALILVLSCFLTIADGISHVFIIIYDLAGASALVLLALKRQLKLKANVVICAALMSIAFANYYLDDNSIIMSGLRAALRIPYFVWLFSGINDALELVKPRISKTFNKKDDRLRHHCMAVFLFSVFALMLYLLANGFPWVGSTPDTINQWNQVHGIIKLSDVHALGHTLFLKFLLSIYDDYKIVILFHVLCTAVLYTAFAAVLMKNGAPLGAVILGIAVFVNPFSNIMPLRFPWKDLPYSVCVGGLTVLLMSDCLEERTEVKAFEAILKAVLYGVMFAGIYLFRLNGIVILIFVGVYLIISYIKEKKAAELISMIAVCGLIISATNWYGYRVLKAESPDNGFSVAVFGSGIAAAVNDGRITEEELDKIGEVLPVEWMKEHYDPREITELIWFSDDTVEDPETEVFCNSFVMAMGANKAEVIKLYFRLLPRHWTAYIENIVFSTRAVWGRERWDARCFYENSTQLILLIFAASVFTTKRVKELIIAFAPVLLNIVSIAISTITNETRYLFPTILLAPFLFIYIVVMWKKDIDNTVESK